MPNYAAQSLNLKVDSSQFAALFGKSSQLDKVLKAELRKQIRNGSKIIVKDMQAEVRKAPTDDSPNDASTGLRERIAASLTVKISTSTSNPGVTIMAGDPLAAEYDGAVRWRHPVFGNTGVWVTQTGREFFGSVGDRHRDDVTKLILAAMDTAAASLAS